MVWRPKVTTGVTTAATANAEAVKTTWNNRGTETNKAGEHDEQNKSNGRNKTGDCDNCDSTETHKNSDD